MRKYSSSFGHCPFGAGGLNPCQDGLWHLFLGEMSMYKRAFTWFCPKIGTTECSFECGGGSNGYLGNAQMNCYIFSLGLPLGFLYLWFNTSLPCYPLPLSPLCVMSRSYSPRQCTMGQAQWKMGKRYFHDSPHFLPLWLLQRKYIEVVLCPVSLLIYTWGPVEDTLLREDIKTKKNVLIRALPEFGGEGGLPLPEFIWHLFLTN